MNGYDWDRRILMILPGPMNPTLKSDLSERPVKPFKELWPILRRYEAEKFHARIVFPRFTKPVESWFHPHPENARVKHLSNELRKVLRAAGLSPEDAQEPQRRARRYWETRMRSIGRSDMIEAMGGHTQRVGYDHYTNVLEWVEALKGEAF